MALNFISDTEESKKTDEEMVRIAKVLASGKIKIEGANEVIASVDGAFIVNHLVEALKEGGDHASADALIEIARKYLREAKLDKQYVAVSDLLSITKKEKKKKELKKKSSSTLANTWANRDFRTGTYGPNKNEAGNFLEDCEGKLISLAEFKRAKLGEEMSVVDFDLVIEQIKLAEGKKDDLGALGKNFVSIINTSDNESMKTAYVLGQGSYTHTTQYISPQYTNTTL